MEGAEHFLQAVGLDADGVEAVPSQATPPATPLTPPQNPPL